MKDGLADQAEELVRGGDRGPQPGGPSLELPVVGGHHDGMLGEAFELRDEVIVGAQKIQYLINGKEVYSMDRAQAVGTGKMLSSTDGIVGIRVSHNLDVHIAGFKITPQ